MKETARKRSDPHAMIEIAERAARKAGAYLLEKLGHARIEAQKSLRDDLLDVDLQAERLILTILRQESPQAGILSEEAGFEGERHLYWIVDPLDGSANFQHASPLFGIAIALVSEQITIGGVIYLPTRDEMFLAMQGRGAYLNETPIHVSGIASLSEAIVHIGDFAWDADPEAINERLQVVSILAQHARRIRMIGTAATDLAYLACGRADLLVNHATPSWDTEAGKLLVQEAGGKVTTRYDNNGQILSIYSNGIIHQAAEDLLGKMKIHLNKDERCLYD